MIAESNKVLDASSDDWLALDFAETRPGRTRLLAWTIAHPVKTLIIANTVLWCPVLSAMIFG
ncbi:hypothetical protein FHS83_000807 [Rhizomicrobium palustre]|jgi:hypothetical protein|uniref:Uncharacterized protein n=1 Tax=Rhizomicrobium palustre TaxID=189966 RepID=A0A846MW84_9PROT|nr:hypothetical protein [Rhizomicrobium palustre]NIK87489.1 hypothetical protein [Rhizomicrobium palustre]